MAITFGQQFKKLMGVLLNTKKFYWSHGEEYFGPINRIHKSHSYCQCEQV